MKGQTTVKEFEMEAVTRLPKHAYDYYRSGANGQVTLESTKQAYDKIYLRPRAEVDPAKFEGTSTEVMGHQVNTPIWIASTAFHKMAHMDGEIASAKAAEAQKTPFMLSSWATTANEEIGAACPNQLKLFQIYMSKIPEVNADLW